MNHHPGLSKYFIAIVPPSPVYEATLKWKDFFKEKFNSKAALRSPPHITLHMPFEWKSKREDILIESLYIFSKSQTGFEIELQAFGCFPPRVIYIQINENTHLKNLQKQLAQYCKTELNLFNANRNEQPFHPHLTVAFRDLKKALFPQAWLAVEHEKFDHHFACTNLTLLKHDGKQWNVLKQFDFQPLGYSSINIKSLD